MTIPTAKPIPNKHQCVTCKKRCLYVPKNECVWYEPKANACGWQDVFDEIDYSWWEGPGDNVYVYG